MSIDIPKLEELLAAKKYYEARQVILSGIEERLPEKDKGEILVGFASTYLEVSNSLQEKYKAALEEVVRGMKKIKASEVGLNDKVRVAELKRELKK